MGQESTCRQRPVKVAALTWGLNTPSSRFRVRQYIPRLMQHGIEVSEYIPFFHSNCGLPSLFKALAHIPGVLASRHADVTWLSRSLVQGYETFERFVKRPRVLDVDDAIWLNRPFGRYTMPHIARAMDVIVAGNDYLADWFSRYCANVHVVPTAVDLDRYHKRSDALAQGRQKFVIRWTGLASNYKYLVMIEAPLKRFLDHHPDAELHLVAQRPWQPKLIAPSRIRFTRWSQQSEADALQQMSVGVMPLPDNEWTKGKCSFKMLQYMAVGLPVIVSPVGMNKEVLQKGNIGLAAVSDDQWYDALKTLYACPKLQIVLGNTARAVVEQYYSCDIVAGKLDNIFRRVSTA